MVHHPEAVKEEWLDKTPSSSKICLSGQQKDVPKEQESNEITLNYNRVYDAMNKPRKRPIVGTKFGPEGESDYISEYLHQAIPLRKENPKRIRLTGARVLTSDKAMQEKEDAKKQKEVEKEKRKKEREIKKKQNQKQNKLTYYHLKTRRCV